MKSKNTTYLNYCNYLNIKIAICEVCHKQDIGIYKIDSKDKNVIENLCALCRDCHTKCHNEVIKRDQMQEIHDVFLYSLGPQK